MKIFTGKDLRKNSAGIFNAVQSEKSAVLTHRDRPEMVLVLRDHYEHLQERAEANGGE